MKYLIKRSSNWHLPVSETVLSWSGVQLCSLGYARVLLSINPLPAGAPPSFEFATQAISHQLIVPFSSMANRTKLDLSLSLSLMFLIIISFINEDTIINWKQVYIIVVNSKTITGIILKWSQKTQDKYQWNIPKYAKMRDLVFNTSHLSITMSTYIWWIHHSIFYKPHINPPKVHLQVSMVAYLQYIVHWEKSKECKCGPCVHIVQGSGTGALTLSFKFNFQLPKVNRVYRRVFAGCLS